MVSPSMRFQLFPWSELRQKPSPTTLMVTSALVRFATTPEQPPGQGSFAPLLVSRSSNELEMSVQVSAAWADQPANRTAQDKIVARREIRRIGEIIGCIWCLMVFDAWGFRTFIGAPWAFG